MCAKKKMQISDCSFCTDFKYILSFYDTLFYKLQYLKADETVNNRKQLKKIQLY